MKKLYSQVYLTNILKMMDSADSRTQPWKSWYSPSAPRANGRIILLGNNGNDNSKSGVFGICSHTTLAQSSSAKYSTQGSEEKEQGQVPQ